VVIASRICAAAHGEQVVVSRATRDVAGDEPLPGASFRPLGRHRLKDVPSATQLFQLLASGLREEFPPLNTLSATSLPALHHRLVGRGDALARVEGLISDGARLVTITGPGGAGKSRLALEVAAGVATERPVHLVGLAPIAESELVPSAVARAIGVRESGGESLLAAIADRLNGTGALLYLDNLEHLAPVAVVVAELLDRTPDLQILATSRVPLNLSTERVSPLEPLALEDATTLFVELASARGVVLQADALESVREICRRLDGLPLAIELVAARLVVLPPAEIVRALGEGLALRMEGPVDLPERQRTLRAAIDWSYVRLTESQRALHECIAVFLDGAGLSDARAVAGNPGTFLPDLEALVGWSLIRSEASDGEVRLSMLETVREHALERLRSEGEFERLHTRHADHFLSLALEAEPHLAGADQAVWLDRLGRESANLSAALDWLVRAGRADDALRATNAVERYWRAEARLTEAKRWLSLGLEHTSELPVELRALTLRSTAHMAMGQSDWATAVPLLEESIELFRESGGRYDEVVSLSYLSFVYLRLGELERAGNLARDALRVAEALAEPRTVAFALMALADVDWARGDHEQALGTYDEAVAISRATGDPLLVVDAVYHSGMAAFQAGDRPRARVAFEEALVRASELHEVPHMAAARFMLAQVAILSDDPARAQDHGRASLKYYSELEDNRSRARCLVILAGAAAASGRPEDAARLLGLAGALRGGDGLDAFETSVLDLHAAELQHLLGGDRLTALELEGAELAGASHLAEVVSPGTEE